MAKYPILKMTQKPLQRFDWDGSKKGLRGKEELDFFTYFCSELDLDTKVRFRLLNNSKPIEPDALKIIDDNRVLNIEIDEPYTLSEKEPIHYMGYDDQRDKLLIDNGISVLRFAEYQVKIFPNECLQIINNVIDSKYFLTGINVNPRFFVDTWTKEQAIAYADEDKRDYYEFSTEKIIESQPQILRTFLNYNKLMEFIKAIIHENYDPNLDLVFVPFEISDLKLHESNNDKMVFCKCDVRLRSRPVIFRKGHEFYLSKNKNIFNSLYDIKANSKKIKIDTPEYFGHYLYGLVLWGNLDNYHTNNLNCKIIG